MEKQPIDNLYTSSDNGKIDFDPDAWINKQAEELSKDPEHVDDTESQKVWDKIRQDKAAEDEAKETKSSAGGDSALDVVFVSSLDMAQGMLCGVISGNGNKDDRYSISEKQKQNLILASTAAGLGEKYVSMFGAEAMFWVMFAGSIAPNVQRAQADRKENLAKQTPMQRMTINDLMNGTNQVKPEHIVRDEKVSDGVKE